MTDFQLDAWRHLGFGLVAVAGLLLARTRPGRRFDRPAHWLAGLIGLAGFLNFGSLHHYHDTGFVNRWELFHYQLGAEYFPELGYDGLYAASWIAQRETDPGRPTGRAIRDLRSNRLRTIPSHASFAESVRARFSDARWADFVRDHAVLLASTPPQAWEEIRTDHGYNATPFWTTVARVFTGILPTGYGSLVALAVLDALLVAIAIAGVAVTYGMRTAALVLAVTGLGFGWHYNFIGAFLRLDWWAASLAALCLLSRRRFAWAGALLGWATLSRLFPALFLIGPLLVTLRGWRGGVVPRPAARLVAGFGAVLLLGLAAGSLAGRGPGAWLEFADRIEVHLGTWTSNAVGLATVVAYDPETLIRDLRAPRSLPAPRERVDQRTPLRVGLGLVLVALAVAVAWTARDAASAAVPGLALLFVLAAPSSYYWIAMALVPLFRGPTPTLAFLGLSAGLYALEIARPAPAFLPLHYAMMAWGLYFLLFGWLLAALRAALEDRTA